MRRSAFLGALDPEAEGDQLAETRLGADLYLRSFGAKTLSSYGLDADRVAEFPALDLAFLRSLRLSYETETHVFVHANLEPDLPLDPPPISPPTSG